MARISLASIRTRLIFLVLTALLPALGLTLYVGLEQRREAVRHAQNDALNLARHAAAMQGNLVDNARQVLFTLSQLFQVHEQDPALYSAIFANLLKQAEGYTGFVAAKPDGAVFASASALTGPMNLADRPYFQRILQTRDFTIGEYQIGRASGKATIVFAYPVFDATGQMQVILITGLDLEWLNRLIAGSGLPAGATCTVIDRNGVILARYPDSQEFVGKAAPESSIVETMLAQGEGVTEAVGLDGVEHLYGFTPLEHTSRSLFVRIGIPKSVAFADADRKLTRNLIVLGIVTILVLFATRLVGNIFILSHVARLLDAANQVAGGNLSTRLGPPYASGELGQLAMAFDEMAAAIQTRETETQQRNSEIAGLFESTRAILEYRNFKDAARRIFDSCKNTTGATAGYVALLSEDGTENKLMFLDPGGHRCTVDPSLPMPIRGLREDVHRSGKVVYCNDFSQSQWVKLLPQGHADLDNVLFAPLVVEEKVVGFLGLANKPGGFTENDARMATALGELAAVALLNSQTWESLQESNEKLVQHREKLEQLIEERTLELTATNEELRQEINERSRAQKELQLERHNLQGILDSMNDGVCVTNQQYHIDYINPVMEKDFGPAGGRKCYEYFHDRTEVCPECRIQEVFAGKSIQWEWFSSKTGMIYDLFDTPIRSMDGSMSKLEIFRDITERVNKEKESSLLATVVEQAAEGVLVTGADWIIQHMNPAFEHTTGYELEEIVGRHHRIFKSGKHDRVFYQAMRSSLDLGRVWRGRLTSKRKDGSFFDAEAVISPVRDTNGNITNWVTIARDITHEVKLEAQLRQGQKMEALGTLAGGIAHDFNNILGIIFGYVQLAQLTIPRGDEAESHLEEVFKAANRAKDLVKQILAFSRQTEQEHQPIQISLIVKESLKMLRASLPSTIEMRQNIASKGLVLGDPTQIHQVLLNLCTNAAHAMGEKSGVLEVNLLDVDLDADFAALYPDVHPGPYLQLKVSDTGHGMSSETMERIFDPYFTTKAPGEGTGLGLAVVHGIIQSHGGMISVVSEPGQGSTFTVLFPKLQTGTNDLIPAGVFPGVLPTGSESILFVDDEEALCRFWRQTLEGLGYKVTIRTSPVEALEAFRAYPDKFDLVITDMTMPKMTGIEFTKELLSIRPELPVILCTGFIHTLTQENARALGIRELAMKPLLVSDLAGAIRRLLDG